VFLVTAKNVSNSQWQSTSVFSSKNIHSSITVNIPILVYVVVFTEECHSFRTFLLHSGAHVGPIFKRLSYDVPKQLGLSSILGSCGYETGF